MKKWWLVFLSLVVVFAFVPASYAKTTERAHQLQQSIKKEKEKEKKQREKKQRASGTISAVDAQAGTITLQTGSNTIQLALDASTKIKISEFKNPTINDIWVGDRAKAEYIQNDTTNLVKELAVVKQKGTIKGEVEAIDTIGSTLTVSGKQVVVSEKTVIRLGKDKLTLADLVEGDKIEGKGFLKEGILQASTIVVKRTFASLKGTVESIQAENNQLVVAGTTITVTADTKVRIHDQEASLADLVVGDNVVIIGLKGQAGFTAKMINAIRQLEEVKGTIASLDAANKTVTIGEKVVTISDKTKLVQDDKEIAFEALQVGNEAEAKGFAMGDKWIALKVKIKAAENGDEEEEGEIEGSVDQIDAAAMTLTIKGVTVLITDKTELTGEKKQPITIADIQIGMKAEAKGKWNENILEAEKIKVESEEEKQ